MSPSAQVLHLIRRDVARGWAVLGGWVLLVAALTGVSLAPATAGIGALSSLPSGALLFVLAALLSAWLVQADPPSREDAHWPTLPLDPMAVLAAKSMLAFAVAGAVPLLGQAATLVAWGIEPADLVRYLGRSSAILGAGIVMGLVLGAASRDLRGAVATLMGGLLFLMLLQGLIWLAPVAAGGSPGVPDGPEAMGPASRLLYGAGGAALAAAFLVHAYRRGRRGRFETGVGAMLALGALLTGLSLSTTDRGRSQADFEWPAPVVFAERGVAVVPSDANLVTVRPFAPRDVRVRSIRMPSSGEGGRLGSGSLLSAQIALEGTWTEGTAREDGLDEGTRRTWLEAERTRVVDPTGRVVSERTLMPDNWLSPYETPGHHPPVQVGLEISEIEGLQNGSLTLELLGHEVVRTRTWLPPLPLSPGAMTRGPGFRARIPHRSESGQRTEGQDQVRLDLSAIMDDVNWRADRPEGFRVRRDMLFEVRLIDEEGGHHLRSPGGSGGGGPGGLLLPGVPGIRWVLQLRRPSDSTPLGEELTFDRPGSPFARKLHVAVWRIDETRPVVLRIRMGGTTGPEDAGSSP